MGFKKAMFSDLSGTIFDEGQGTEIRIKVPGENGAEPTHVKVDALISDELTTEDGKPLTVADLVAAGTEVKPRGRKPADASAKK